MKIFGILLLTLWSFSAFADIELVTPISSEREDGLDEAQDNVFVDTDGIVSWYVKERGFVPVKEGAPTAVAQQAPGKNAPTKPGKKAPAAKVAVKNQKPPLRKLASDGKKPVHKKALPKKGKKP